jgi:hypothetical protein
MTSLPEGLWVTAQTVLERSREYDLSTLNEANTKALFIEPLLAALGWDVLDLNAVTREYSVFDGTFLDYALLVEKRPALFCEAKPTKKSLDDPKWMAQTINYANNEGVVWCVLTDGLRWRVFRANWPAPMDKKLAFEVTLEELFDEEKGDRARQLFACLTPSAVSEGELSRLGTQIFVDGRVQEVLIDLLESPPPKLVELIRSQFGADHGLKPADVRGALARVAAPAVAALSEAPASLPPRTGDEKTPSPTQPPTQRLRGGERTPPHEFEIPILRSLVGLGGKGTVSEVLDKVETQMRERLTDVDADPLPSNAKAVRWRNTAQWARNSMVQRGLLEEVAERGVWEISAAGRQELAAHDAAASSVGAVLTFLHPSPVAPTLALWKGDEELAWARLESDARVTVMAGSRVAVSGSSSESAVVASLRRAITEGAAAREGEYVKLAEDQAPLSASAAAELVVGHSVNGRQAWKTADGKTYHQLVTGPG